MNPEDIQKQVEAIPEEVLNHIFDGMKFSMPWQYDVTEADYPDPDGFPAGSSIKKGYRYTREQLQEECWNKFNSNPYMNTSVRDLVGRICGWGFESQSGIFEIQQVMDEIVDDPRNRLYHFWPKMFGRANVEGELFTILSLHEDGFVEVDFLDPSSLSSGGDEDTGIIFHPRKSLFPLFYIISRGELGEEEVQIPSINIAYYPELVSLAKKHPDYNRSYQQDSRSRKGVYRKLGGYTQFVVSWDKGFMTRRAVSYLRTTLEWLNYYENLKKYEIDHKKSSGSYLWIFKITDARTFKLWLSLSDDDRRKTGIMAKKTPGSTLVLPPGIEVEAKNPQLAPIRDQDSDIKEFVTSGLNQAEDVTTGTAKGTYASVKASRGPMSDRISDEIAYFDRFLKFDFWRAIFFLRSAATDFPRTFKVRKAIRYKISEGKDPKPEFKNVPHPPEKLITVQYPVSEMLDYETRAKGLLGTKHGPVSETVGIPKAEVSRRMGFGDYTKSRLEKETEDENFPELVYTADAEGIQERSEGNITESKSKSQPAATKKPVKEQK